MTAEAEDAETFLGAFEQLVLLAVVRLGDEAYGMTVRREIETRTSRTVSLGAVYATIDRLEKKGHLQSRPVAEAEARPGRARRLLSVAPDGTRALRRTLEGLDRMRADTRGFELMGVRR